MVHFMHCSRLIPLHRCTWTCRGFTKQWHSHSSASSQKYHSSDKGNSSTSVLRSGGTATAFPSAVKRCSCGCSETPPFFLFPLSPISVVDKTKQENFLICFTTTGALTAIYFLLPKPCRQTIPSTSLRVSTVLLQHHCLEMKPRYRSMPFRFLCILHSRRADSALNIDTTAFESRTSVAKHGKSSTHSQANLPEPHKWKNSVLQWVPMDFKLLNTPAIVSCVLTQQIHHSLLWTRDIKLSVTHSILTFTPMDC